LDCFATPTVPQGFPDSSLTAIKIAHQDGMIRAYSADLMNMAEALDMESVAKRQR